MERALTLSSFDWSVTEWGRRNTKSVASCSVLSFRDGNVRDCGVAFVEETRARVHHEWTWPEDVLKQSGPSPSHTALWTVLVCSQHVTNAAKTSTKTITRVSSFQLSFAALVQYSEKVLACPPTTNQIRLLETGQIPMLIRLQTTYSAPGLHPATPTGRRGWKVMEQKPEQKEKTTREHRQTK